MKTLNIEKVTNNFVITIVRDYETGQQKSFQYHSTFLLFCDNFEIVYR